MSSKIGRIVYGLFLALLIELIKGSNATSFTSSVKAVTSTTTTLQQATSVSPTPTSTVVPQATKAVTMPPPPPTPPPTHPPEPPSKRTYSFFVTLANVPWKNEYNTNPLSVMRVAGPFIIEMESLFKNGSFPELKNKLPTTSGLQNDTGKFRIGFEVRFGAVPAQGSKEPEVYFRLKNFEKGSEYKYYVIPSSIRVNEKVEGGVDFGNWTGEIPESCCGENVFQTRTCVKPGAGTCDGVHRNRTFPCQAMYPVTCGKERRFTFNITLEEKWIDGYKDSSSSELRGLKKRLLTGEESLLEGVKSIFKNSSTGFKQIDLASVKMFQDNGKVAVSFTVLFNEPPSNPEDPDALFRFKTENGKLGSFKIDTKSIKVEESVSGYTFTPWTNKASDCDKCCGGPIQQTRTCQSKIGRCPNAQVKRSIRCKHVCEEVKCGGASLSVPYVLGILICILAPFIFGI